MESWEEPDEIKRSMDVILEIEAEASRNISGKEGLMELLQLLANSKVCVWLPGWLALLQHTGFKPVCRLQGPHTLRATVACRAAYQTCQRGPLQSGNQALTTCSTAQTSCTLKPVLTLCPQFT